MNELPLYRSTYTVRAAKVVGIKRVNGHDALTLAGMDKPFRVEAGWSDYHHPSEGGYLVVRDDHLVQFKTEEQFDSEYGPIDPAPPEPRTTGLTFGDALVAIKDGKKVGLPQWRGNYINLHDDGLRICHSFLIHKAAWLPEASDLLATDWYIVTGE